MPEAATFHIWLTYALLVTAIALFVSERIRIEISALIVLMALVVLFELMPLTPAPGQPPLDTGRLIAGLANPALVAVMALLVLGHGLSRAGALDWALKAFMTITGDRQVLAIVVAFVTVLVASAFVNNTPIVIIFIPILESIARRFELAPSRLMMPLSFAAILAGMTTLIGSSTNLLVSGAMKQAGMAPLGFFDFIIFGMILAAIGLIYLIVVAPRLLKQRRSPMKRFTTGADRHFVAQMVVGEESKLIGETAVFNVLGIKGSRLILVQQREKSHVPPFNELAIAAGDTLVIIATREALAEAQANYPHLMFDMTGEDLPEDEEERKARLGRDQMLTEVMIAPGSTFVGRTLEEIGFCHRFEGFPARRRPAGGGHLDRLQPDWVLRALVRVNRVAVIQRPVSPTQAGGGFDGTAHISARTADRRRQFQPLGQPAGDGRSQRAAGSVGVTAFNTRIGKSFNAICVDQDVGHCFPRQVTTLQQYRRGAHVAKCCRRCRHRRDIENRHPGQCLGFGQVRCQHRRQRHKVVFQHRHRLTVQKPCPALGHHDRVHHDRHPGPRRQNSGDRFNGNAIAQHTGLDGIGADVIEDAVHLRGNEIRWHRMDRLNAVGILGGQRRDRGRRIAAQRRYRLDVGLDPGAAAGIGTGNDENAAAHVRTRRGRGQ